ncbi:tellurite resistance/C4-dicarboxylate transporter family protein [Rhodococcus koreensis]|uniref:tellurite resistance/C4-dicarboxylate transporter family protein n=1 Tax=Rhodococcus koreensis TaxID=99653 RepID=UPI00197D31D1|nr:tellurite resistance/C4-dicarboxylate transporter family protein [Rhodococcus koreensis]QSE79771.1 tellurite resistance/C4-dicarboxylate transporter family protein [Rhodococcus koreensis]
MTVVRDRLEDSVRSLNPGYFAIVMASGIISVGMKLGGFDVLSVLLFIVCAAAYVTLVILTIWRIAAYRRQVVDDLTDASRGFGFFTFIAGTDVFGVRLAMDGHHAATAVLLTVAGLTWIVLGYVVPWTAVLGTSERPVVARANGTWFIWVVAAQSVAVAAATLEPVYDGARRFLAVVAVFTWSIGVCLYGAAGIFVAARMLLYPLRPRDLTAPYWVAMGACAITVLAGARIVEMEDAPMVNATRGLIGGFAVVFWAFATWLIPVLVAAGWWRHITNKVPLRYDATVWSIVFPLGMYAVAGIYLGRADHIPLVGMVGSAELWCAFTVWCVAFVVMVVHLWRSVVQVGPATVETQESA